MSGVSGRFPEYGNGGDFIGARRNRQAFRLAVLSCVLLTAILWVSEHFLRYDSAERLFLRALTMPEAPSSRVLLRMAVKMKEEQGPGQTLDPRYVVALAEREEEDLILPAYEKAFTLNPNDPFIAIRYGCHLFQAAQFEQARGCFQKSGQLPPKNALPRYLEAASYLERADEDEALAESLALIARTNSGAAKVTFPLPVWSPSLPSRGEWYAELRRHVVDQCCAPIYRYVQRVARRAEREIAEGRGGAWDTWLVMIEQMGDRLAASTEPGSLQAIAGVRIQLSALSLRAQISERETQTATQGLNARRRALEEALGRLNAFESSRADLIAADRQKFKQPFRLAGRTLLALALFYTLMWVMEKLVGSSEQRRIVPHARSGIIAVLSANAVALLLLYIMMWLQGAPGGHSSGLLIVGVSWWVAVLCAISFGLVYPFIALVSPHKVLHQRNTDSEGRDDVLQEARRCWRPAAMSLAKRYFGLMFGLSLSVLCFWSVSYRILAGLYPWQFELLTTGLAEQELDAVIAALTLLN